MVLLYFLGCLAGIVLVAIVTNRLTGTRAHYVENFRLEPSEQVLWRGARADVNIIPLRRAVFTSFPRLRRDTLILTNKRLVCGRRTLLGSRHMVQIEVFFDPAFPGAERAARLDRGFWGGGFQAFVVSSKERIALKTEAQRHHLELRPDKRSPNVDYIRIALDEPYDLYQKLLQSVS